MKNLILLALIAAITIGTKVEVTTGFFVGCVGQAIADLNDELLIVDVTCPGAIRMNMLYVKKSEIKIVEGTNGKLSF